MISRAGAHPSRRAERERPRPGAQGSAERRGEATQHAPACEREEKREEAPAPQTPWSQGAAFQTFYELSLTREKRERGERSPELQHHGNISHFSQSEASDL